jgi:hypothetical protein
LMIRIPMKTATSPSGSTFLVAYWSSPEPGATRRFVWFRQDGVRSCQLPLERRESRFVSTTTFGMVSGPGGRCG